MEKELNKINKNMEIKILINLINFLTIKLNIIISQSYILNIHKINLFL